MPAGAPVGQQTLHIGHAVLLPFDEIGGVADLLLLLVDARDILPHGLVADLHVADWVIAEPGRIGFPDLHAVSHQLAHCRLEIVVPHNAAGDAAGAGRDRRLVEHQDVFAVAPSGRFQPFGQPPSGRQPVNPRTDHDMAGMGGKTHRSAPSDRFVRANAFLPAPSELTKTACGTAKFIVPTVSRAYPVSSRRHPLPTSATRHDPGNPARTISHMAVPDSPDRHARGRGPAFRRHAADNRVPRWRDPLGGCDRPAGAPRAGGKHGFLRISGQEES